MGRSPEIAVRSLRGPFAVEERNPSRHANPPAATPGDGGCDAAAFLRVGLDVDRTRRLRQLIAPLGTDARVRSKTVVEATRRGVPYPPAMKRQTVRTASGSP